MAKQIDAKTLAMVTAAVIKALGAQQPKQAKAKPYKAPKLKIDPKADLSTKEQRKLQLELLTKEVFEKAGYTNVLPRVNVLTYKGWGAIGKSPLPGQQPVWVKAPWMSAKQQGYPMFHESQVA